MAQQVNIDGVGMVSFPDGMSMADMSHSIENELMPALKSGSLKLPGQPAAASDQGSGGALPAQNPADQKPGMVESAVRGANNGLFFGAMPVLAGLNAADPLSSESAPDPAHPLPSNTNPIGALAGLGTLAAQWAAPSVFGTGAADRYEQRRREELSRNQDAQKSNPGTYLGGELGGGLAGAVALPMATPFRAGAEAGMLARGAAGAGNLAANGAIQGGLGAAGTAVSEEQSPAQAAGDIAKGAAIGGIAGPVIGGAVHAAGAIPDGLSALGSLFRPAALGARQADTAISNAIDKSAAAGPLPKGAGDKLADAGVSLGDLVKDVEAAHSTGKTSYTLADAVNDALGPDGKIASTNGALNPIVKDITSAGTTDGSGARNFIEQRVNDQRNRMDQHLSELAPAPIDNPTAISELQAQQQAKSGPLYDAARLDPIDPTTSPYGASGLTLDDMTDRLQSTGAWAAAKKSMADEGIPFDTTTLQPWQYMKQALDTKISNALKNDDVNNARIWGDLRDKLAQELKDQSPTYGSADEIFAEHARKIDALNAGAASAKSNVSMPRVQQQLASLSPEEQQLYQLAHINALKEQNAAASSPDALLPSFATNGLAAQKLRAIGTDPDKLSAFTQRIGEEQGIAKTNAAAAGSPSSAAGKWGDRANSWEQYATGSAGIHALATGNLAGVGTAIAAHTVYKLGRYALRQWGQANRDGFIAQARSIALNPDPDAVRAFMERVNSLKAPAALKAGVLSQFANVALRSGPVSGSASNVLGQSAARTPQPRVVAPAPASPAPAPPPKHWVPVRKAGSQGPATHMHAPATGEIRPISDEDVNLGAAAQRYRTPPTPTRATAPTKTAAPARTTALANDDEED